MSKATANGASSAQVAEIHHIVARHQQEIDRLQRLLNEVQADDRTLARLDRKVSALLHAFVTLGKNCEEALSHE